jgi:hypothetical protein
MQVYSEVENWDVCDNVKEVYRYAMKEYGRCTSKVYVDSVDGKPRHVGWIFVKKVQYTDCKDTYLQETWIAPLAKHEIQTITEYAI